MAVRTRERKRHVQVDWLNEAGTRRKAVARAGKRAPGRPRKEGRRNEPHTVRPAFKASHPVHVVLRVDSALGNLRRRAVFRAVREATIAVAKGERVDFRIVHLSIQRTHLHFLVEADGRTALARGMQSFQISAAKHMNAALGWATRRRGRVFVDRYHAELITSRRQARHALAYVLNNWRKHREDRGTAWNVDPFSSGCSFAGWTAFARRLVMWHVPAGYHPLVVWLPRTWLLQQGWMLYGRIDFREVPGPRPAAAR